MKHLSPTRYIPANSTPHTLEGADAIVYLYITTASDKSGGIAYIGKANNPAWHYSFGTVARAEQYTSEWLEGIRETQQAKAQRKAEIAAIKAEGHPFQVGDIMHWSWGYDQTNCDFYQVTAVTKGTVTLRKIAAKDADKSTGNSMACYLVAIKDAFLKDEEPFVKRPQCYSADSWYIPMEYGHCDKWNGRAEYCSWYA